MANWANLKAAIADAIKANGTNAITGDLLQTTLVSIVSNLGENATFKGIAIPTTVPGTPDGNIFYIATEKGIYTNFGGLEIINSDGMVIFNYNGNWNKLNIDTVVNNEFIKLGSESNINNNSYIKFIEGSYFDATNGNKVIDPNYDTFILKLPYDFKNYKLNNFTAFRASEYNGFPSTQTYLGMSNTSSNIETYQKILPDFKYGTKYSNAKYIAFVIEKAENINLDIASIEIGNTNLDNYVLGRNSYLQKFYNKYYDHLGNLVSDADRHSIICKVPNNATMFKLNSAYNAEYYAIYSEYPVGIESKKWKGLANYNGNYIPIGVENNNNLWVEFLFLNTVDTSNIDIIFDTSYTIKKEVEFNINNMDGYEKIDIYNMLTSGNAYSTIDGSVASSGVAFTIVIEVSEGDIIHIKGLMPDSYLFYKSGDISASTFLYSVEQKNPWKYFKNLTTIVPPSCKYVVYQWDSSYSESGIINTSLLFHKNKSIVLCLGDSLTHGYNGNLVNTSYPQELQLLLDNNNNLGVINGGYDSDSPNNIQGRQGCKPLVTKNNISLPATTDKVQIGTKEDCGIITCDNILSNSFGLPFQYRCGKYLGYFNPFTVNGIECELTNDGTDYQNETTYYINRITPGDAITIKAGTPIYTSLSKIKTPHTLILWEGSNYTPTVEQLVERTKLSIDYARTSNFIVVGLHNVGNGQGVTYMQELESAYLREFGLQFFNLREYLITNALSDANITPTQQDLDDIASGNCPHSLMISDGVHFTEIAYRLIANKIYKLGQHLGYWR